MNHARTTINSVKWIFVNQSVFTWEVVICVLGFSLIKIFAIHINSCTLLKSLMPWFSKSMYFLKTFHPKYIGSFKGNTVGKAIKTYKNYHRKDFSWGSKEKAFCSPQLTVLHYFFTNSFPQSPQIQAGTQSHPSTLKCNHVTKF